MTLALVAKTAEDAAAHELPVPPWAFGVGALVAFLVLLLITFAFKSVGTRHD